MIGLGALSIGPVGCAHPGATPASSVPGEDTEAAMVALRRENEALARENELLRDKQLMCQAPRSSTLPAGPVKLVPSDAGSDEGRRARGVSLQDLPHSAPDAAVMERYAASAASSQPSDEGPADPKRYRIVGPQQSPARSGSRSKSQKLGVKTIYANARRHYVDGERVRARLLFKEIEQAYASSDLADNAIYWLAEDDREAGRLSQAEAGFMRILSDYPAGNKVEDAMFMLGLCFKDQLQFAQARDMLTKVVSLGRKELAVKARHQLALIGELESKSDSMNGR